MDNKTMLTGQPFDDLKSLLNQLPDADSCAAKKIRSALAERAIDAETGASELLAWLGMWQGTDQPKVKESHICALVSAYEGQGGKEEALAFVAATAKGAAPVNLLCVDKGIGLRAIELAPQMPHDLTTEWSQQDCMAAVAFGMEATAAGGDLLGLTDLAPGNDVHAMAIILASLEGAPDKLGTVSDQQCLKEAQAMLAEKGNQETPLEAMRTFGGREIAAAVGAIVAARSRRLPVVVDGWAGLAACCVLEACAPNSTGHVRPAAVDGPLQQAVWGMLGKTPIVGAPVGVGPGCGSAISVSVMDACCMLLNLREAKS